MTIAPARRNRASAAHAGFYRTRELPRESRRDPGLDVIDDTAMAKIMAGIGLLDDPQAMRIMMLQAGLGRRISEIMMLDPDPLLPLPGGPAGAGEPGAMVARLRYQQTKIDGAPDTILVDAEIVAIIRAQQEWAATWLREHAAPSALPRYLFLGLLFNATPTGHTCPRPCTTRSASWPGGSTSATAQAGRSTSTGRPGSGPPGHQPAQCRRPGPRRAALPRAPLARHDDALRPDPCRNPRSRVPALPQAHRRRPRARGRRP